MRSVSASLRVGIAACAALLMCAAPTAAQIDITGVWQQPGNGLDTLVDVRPGMTAAFRGGQYEDMWERCCGGGAGRGGPTAVDFIGIPLNDAGRARALAHDDSLWEVPEHQCQPHHAAYAYWGVGSPTITAVLNEAGRLVAYHVEGTYRRLPREIWMDGRPHPPEYALHTWAGFTTGEWHGNTLVAKTTHLKKGWVRRNGAPTSDQATLLTYFARHGDVLTVTVFVDDPLYFTEPYIKSTDYALAPRIPTASFESADNPGTCYGHTTVVFRDEHPVPHWLPGQNPSVGERAAALHIPVEATLGFAESAYPEFIDKIKAWREQNPIGKSAAPAPQGGSSGR